ncbi:hypothetical protein FIM72_00920 [Helicobacter pylori]|nr:hypothetical protein FIM72_00920 [Helicobacter pylori]
MVISKKKKINPPIKKCFLKIIAEVFYSLKTLKRIFHQTLPHKKKGLKKREFKKKDFKKKDFKKKSLKKKALKKSLKKGSFIKA